MGLENTNTIAIIKQTKNQATYLRKGILGVLIPPFTQPVPCLRISERPVRVHSDQNTRWRLLYTKQKKHKSIKGRCDTALSREGAILLMKSSYVIL